MGIQFIWEEKFELGDPNVDKEHKRMFDLANSISEDMGEEEIKGILKNLVKQSSEHFTHEEKIMETTGYPKFGEHRIHHQNLKTKLHKMHIRSFEEDRLKFTFQKFICDWMIDHIMYHDRDFFQFTQERNIDSSK